MSTIVLSPDCEISLEHNEKWFEGYMARSEHVRKRIKEMNAKFYQIHNDMQTAIKNGDMDKADNLSHEIAIVRDLLKTLHLIHLQCL